MTCGDLMDAGKLGMACLVLRGSLDTQQEKVQPNAVYALAAWQHDTSRSSHEASGICLPSGSDGLHTER